MKKAKIMLTAITVLAVVGGALAFKAKTFNGAIYTTNLPKDGAICPAANRVLGFSETIVGGVLTSATTDPDTECVALFTAANP